MKCEFKMNNAAVFFCASIIILAALFFLTCLIDPQNGPLKNLCSFKANLSPDPCAFWLPKPISISLKLFFLWNLFRSVVYINLAKKIDESGFPQVMEGINAD